MRLQVSSALAALALGLVVWSSAAGAGNLSDPAALNAEAPAVYQAKFDTSKGPFVIEVHRDWAPLGLESGVEPSTRRPSHVSLRQPLSYL